MWETQATGRIRVLVRLAFVWALLIVAKLVYLQVWQHKEFVRIAHQQQEKLFEIQGPRGTIFDRNGQPLAKSLPVDSVCVNPLRIVDVPVAARFLAKTLDLDEAKIAANIRSQAAKGRGFLWIKRRITPQESARLRSLNLEWIEFRTESRRFYPNGQLASHAVGTVDFAEKGDSGLERRLDQDLAGRVGEVRMMSDSKQHAFAAEVDSQSLPGRDVVLTIDSRIQYIAERELAAAAERSNAKSGSLVAMNPKTGEILALANWPTFDPNEPLTKENAVGRENRAITSPYEPGSVFKVVTLSAALEATKARPETMVNCQHGILRIGARTIHEAHGGYGMLSMADVLAKSSNIGAIQFGMMVKSPALFDYVHRFGFGAPTGVGLPGESGGKVRRLEKWSLTSLASVSMGHEVSVTAMQLAQACSVIASGGLLVKPRLVIKKQRQGEVVAPEPEDKPRRVLRPETAITMRQMMEGVVLHGTAKGKANLKGYTSGGKTGTALIYDANTHSYTHKYNGSFMGFAPVANPAVVIVVTLNGTQGNAGYGGSVAAPVFREVATAALRLLDVPKDLPEDLPPTSEEPGDTNDLSIAGLDLAAAAEFAEAPTPIGPPGLEQQMFPAIAQNLGPRVPDFQGKTMRDVLEEAASSGTPVELVGRGIARAQMPQPGAPLPPGEKVRVRFAR